MRMQRRRLTRLTNAFSKKWDRLYAMLALYFAWYNFVRVHQTLKVTPAMEAGVPGRVWTIGELVGTVSPNFGKYLMRAIVKDARNMGKKPLSRSFSATHNRSKGNR